MQSPTINAKKRKKDKTIEIPKQSSFKHIFRNLYKSEIFSFYAMIRHCQSQLDESRCAANLAARMEPIKRRVPVQMRARANQTRRSLDSCWLFAVRCPNSGLTELSLSPEGMRIKWVSCFILFWFENATLKKGLFIALSRLLGFVIRCGFVPFDDNCRASASSE